MASKANHHDAAHEAALVKPVATPIRNGKGRGSNQLDASMGLDVSQTLANSPWTHRLAQSFPTVSVTKSRSEAGSFSSVCVLRFLVRSLSFPAGCASFS